MLRSRINYLDIRAAVTIPTIAPIKNPDIAEPTAIFILSLRDFFSDTFLLSK
jgi:hypothetical protein